MSWVYRRPTDFCNVGCTRTLQTQLQAELGDFLTQHLAIFSRKLPMPDPEVYRRPDDFRFVEGMGPDWIKLLPRRGRIFIIS